jgi:hypothetical protein
MLARARGRASAKGSAMGSSVKSTFPNLLLDDSEKTVQQLNKLVELAFVDSDSIDRVSACVVDEVKIPKIKDGNHNETKLALDRMYERYIGSDGRARVTVYDDEKGGGLKVMWEAHVSTPAGAPFLHVTPEWVMNQMRARSKKLKMEESDQVPIITEEVNRVLDDMYVSFLGAEGRPKVTSFYDGKGGGLCLLWSTFLNSGQGQQFQNVPADWVMGQLKLRYKRDKKQTIPLEVHMNNTLVHNAGGNNNNNNNNMGIKYNVHHNTVVNMGGNVSNQHHNNSQGHQQPQLPHQGHHQPQQQQHQQHQHQHQQHQHQHQLNHSTNENHINTQMHAQMNPNSVNMMSNVNQLNDMNEMGQHQHGMGNNNKRKADELNMMTMEESHLLSHVEEAGHSHVEEAGHSHVEEAGHSHINAQQQHHHNLTEMNNMENQHHQQQQHMHHHTQQANIESLLGVQVQDVNETQGGFRISSMDV